jgi:HPt (histidine-containing phosphotransfer) domain-containing protein
VTTSAAFTVPVVALSVLLAPDVRSAVAPALLVASAAITTAYAGRFSGLVSSAIGTASLAWMNWVGGVDALALGAQLVALLAVSLGIGAVRQLRTDGSRDDAPRPTPSDRDDERAEPDSLERRESDDAPSSTPSQTHSTAPDPTPSDAAPSSHEESDPPSSRTSDDALGTATPTPAPARISMQFEVALDRAGGDPSIVRELGQLLATEAPRWLDELDTAIAARDAKAAGRAAHTLFSSADYWGNTDARALADRVVKDCRAEQLDELAATSVALREAYTELLQATSEVVASLPVPVPRAFPDVGGPKSSRRGTTTKRPKPAPPEVEGSTADETPAPSVRSRAKRRPKPDE